MNRPAAPGLMGHLRPGRYTNRNQGTTDVNMYIPSGVSGVSVLGHLWYRSMLNGGENDITINIFGPDNANYGLTLSIRMV